MIVNGIEYNLIQCMKCGYEWLSRLDCPKQCPKCHRYEFWLPKGIKSQMPQYSKKMANRYPIQDLKVGQEIILPWHTNDRGLPDINKNNSIQRAVRQEESRKGKKFERYPSASGLRLVRIK